MNKRIAIIGGGNLGQAIASGLLSENFNASTVTITRNKTELLSTFKARGVEVTSNNIEAVQKSEIIIIAVKPYRMESALKEISSYISNEHTLISVVSNFSIDSINNLLQSSPILFRAMPNTAASVNESITCIASHNASEEDTKTVHSIFNAL